MNENNIQIVRNRAAVRSTGKAITGILQLLEKKSKNDSIRIRAHYWIVKNRN